VDFTAAGGLVSVADPGDFGPVTITRAITIDGGGVGGNLTFTSEVGIYVNAGASDTVILRHLTINGLGVGGDGIYFNAGKVLWSKIATSTRSRALASWSSPMGHKMSS
jgi:hypothetical protein